MDSWTETEPDFALAICSAVIDALDPTADRPMIVIPRDATSELRLLVTAPAEVNPEKSIPVRFHVTDIGLGAGEVHPAGGTHHPEIDHLDISCFLRLVGREDRVLPGLDLQYVPRLTGQHHGGDLGAVHQERVLFVDAGDDP